MLKTFWEPSKGWAGWRRVAPSLVIWNTKGRFHWFPYGTALVLVPQHNPVPWLLHPGGATGLREDSVWRVCPHGGGLKIGIKTELTLVKGAEASRWLQRKVAVLLLSHLDSNIQGRNKEFRFCPNVNSLYHVAIFIIWYVVLAFTGKCICSVVSIWKALDDWYCNSASVLYLKQCNMYF